MSETCPKLGWHDYVVVLDAPDAQVEVCSGCAHKVIYGKERGTGRVDNARYLRDHVRDFCQPYGPTSTVYLRTYGIEALRGHHEYLNSRKSKADLKEGFAEVREDVRRMKRTSNV